MAKITDKYTIGWYGGCECEDVMVSTFDTETTRGRLTFISTDFAGSSYYFARVRSSFDRLSCGKFYIVSNETGGNIDIPYFNILSTDGGKSITECCGLPEPTPPTIISPWHVGSDSVDIQVAENTKNVMTIVASGDDPIVYSLANYSDNSKFDLNSSSGVLNFKVAPDFENPQDSNEDNVYSIKVIATNNVGTDEVTINIEVIDVDDDTIPTPNCSLVGEIEDSCIEVTANNGFDTTLEGIYTYNQEGSSYQGVDNTKPSWVKKNNNAIELFYIGGEVGYWAFKYESGEIAAGRPWGFETDHTSAQIPQYPWCTLSSDETFDGHLWPFAKVKQIDCPDPVVIPCCNGFTYTHDKSTEDDPTQTGEKYGDVELQKSKNPFPTIESQYPQWNISTLCHNGATGGVPSRSPIDVTSHQDYLGLTSYPYKHGEIALGAEYVGEMRVTLVNGECYHACVSPELEEIIFVPESEPLDCG